MTERLKRFLLLAIYDCCLSDLWLWFLVGSSEAVFVSLLRHADCAYSSDAYSLYILIVSSGPRGLFAFLLALTTDILFCFSDRSDQLVHFGYVATSEFHLSSKR